MKTLQNKHVTWATKPHTSLLSVRYRLMPCSRIPGVSHALEIKVGSYKRRRTVGGNLPQAQVQTVGELVICPNLPSNFRPILLAVHYASRYQTMILDLCGLLVVLLACVSYRINPRNKDLQDFPNRSYCFPQL